MKKIPRKIYIFIKESIKILMLILIFSTIYNFWYIHQQQGYYEQYVIHTTELRVLTQEIAKYAGEAIVEHRKDIFENLKTTYMDIEQEMDILKNGKKENGKTILPPSPEEIKINELSRFSESWNSIKPKVSIIFDNQGVVLALNETSDRLIGNIGKIQWIYRDIVDILGNANKNENKRIIEIEKLIDLGDSIVVNSKNILTVSNDTVSLRKSFSDKTNDFFSTAQLIQKQNSDVALDKKFTEIEAYLKLVREDVNSVNEVGAVADKVYIAMLEIFNSTPLITNFSKKLGDAYVNYPKNNTVIQNTAYILGLLSLLILILSISLYHRESEYHLKMTEEKNKAMQLEVEKLLKELPEIANGNALEELREDVTTSGGDDIITESFTYALNTLRKLVYNIGKTAKNVSMAALDAQKITKELAASSGNQAREIVEVTASVSAMANSIELVSTNASESAAVALESVNIAGEGGKVVRSTISGMERIQAQIQETSNYMRRLSDSSQEIGEIVSLIDGIADQTNILSLNAAIQAAMAGEAGRGFAVVADEVQRLAEKVSYATKEIGSLVRSIQTDTSQVIGAMEQTKAQVLEGVNFAQDAGSTLEKIETVSRRLSDLIQNISLSASEQAVVSGKISHIMNDVKDIAKQAASGTIATVDLIEKLVKYVTDLRNSVFELKLPEDPK